MNLLASTTTLLGKELRTEFRSRELLTTTIVFILVVLILFSFAISPTAEESREFGPGLLWLAVLFAASLMLQPCFLREQNNDTLSSLRLAVSDPFAIFLAKLIANTLFLVLTEILMLPLFAAFYNIPILPQLHYLLLVLLLGSLGVSVAGTALSAISAQARMRELLLPLLLLPLLTPVLVVSATVSVSLLEREPVVQWKGIGFLAVFDLIFLTALWLCGDPAGHRRCLCRLLHRPQRTHHGCPAADFLFPRGDRLGGHGCILYLLRRQSALCLEAPAEIRLARRHLRRSRSGLHHGCTDHRPHLGQTGLGYLVDLGRAPHVHIRVVAAVHFLLVVALVDRRTRTSGPSQRAVRDLRVY